MIKRGGTQLGCRQEAGQLAASLLPILSFDGFVCFVTKKQSEFNFDKYWIVIRRIVPNVSIE